MFRIRPPLSRLNKQPTKFSSVWSPNLSIRARIGTKAGLLNHWKEEKLVTTEKYPLSLELFDKMHPNTEEPVARRAAGNARFNKKTITTRHVRTQLVSPDLCGTLSPERELVETV